MRITESQLRRLIREELLAESGVYFYRDQSSGQMMYSDDEGNKGRATHGAPEGQTLTYDQARMYMADQGGGYVAPRGDSYGRRRRSY